MRRTASEVVRDLEIRVARLEKQSYGYKVETQREEWANRNAKLNGKIAMRSIPRPPHYNGNILTLSEATRISDKALNDKYRYGLSSPGSFGYEANKYSSLYALSTILFMSQKETLSIEDKSLVEIVARAVHDGWSYAAYFVDDPVYVAKPEKKANRIALADTLYHDLSDDEKEKDRVIARALIRAFVLRN